VHVFALIILILIPIGGWCVRTQGAMLGWFADGLKTNMGGFSYVDFFPIELQHLHCCGCFTSDLDGLWA